MSEETLPRAALLPSPRLRMAGGLLVPRRVTIETIYGCNFHCPMCPIDLPSKRKKGLMKWELYKKIIDDLTSYKDDIEMMDLFSLGEPLLDKFLFERIRYAKAVGFRNVGISTNASLLNPQKQRLLLESGVDHVIFSIDGVTKETYEKIRVGGIFEIDIKNCLETIAMRDSDGYPARFLVRFIRQDKNRHEVGAFLKFWRDQIDKSKGDAISIYDAHTFGGTTGIKDDLVSGRDESIEKASCFIIFDILYILADGRVPLCNEDWLNGDYNFGNAANNHPIDIFNSPRFQEIRALHNRGEKTCMQICKDCTVLYSETTKQTF